MDRKNLIIAKILIFIVLIVILLLSQQASKNLERSSDIPQASDIEQKTTTDSINYYYVKRALKNLTKPPETGMTEIATTEISGIQMVLLKQGEIVFNHAEGFAMINQMGEKEALTIHHKMRIASISKLIMTMAFMKLVDEGKVDLDADVSEYLNFNLKNPHFPKSIITARQLLSHTSSIRDEGHYFLPVGGSFETLFDSEQNDYPAKRFAKEVNQAPGKYFTYSNLNFGVLAAIIENVTGERFDQYVSKTLFQPLNLNISFNPCEIILNQDMLAGLYRKGEGGSVWRPEGAWQEQVDGFTIGCFYGDEKKQRMAISKGNSLPDYRSIDSSTAGYKIGSNPTLFSPQGGLRASATDLAILMQEFLKQNVQSFVLSDSSRQQMIKTNWQYNAEIENGANEEHQPSVKGRTFSQYGLSVHKVNLKDWGLDEISGEMQTLYGHLGEAYGLLGQFWFEPQTGNGIVILINGVGDDPAKAKSSTPIHGIEEQALRIALEALNKD